MGIAFLAFVCALGWALAVWLRRQDKKRYRNIKSNFDIYNKHVSFLQDERDMWKKLAEDRSTEGDEWKD